jgi:hypothetical protein
MITRERPEFNPDSEAHSSPDRLHEWCERAGALGGGKRPRLSR